MKAPHAALMFILSFVFGAVGVVKIAVWLYFHIPGGYLILGAVIFSVLGIIFQYQYETI